jgi:hypothetical protein
VSTKTKPEDGKAAESMGPGRRRRAVIAVERRHRRGTDSRPNRRRRKLIKRWIAGTAAVVIAITGWSILGALTAPGNDSVAARLAEWGRDHAMSGAVTWLENEKYNLNPPKTGGTPNQDDLNRMRAAAPATTREPPASASATSAAPGTAPKPKDPTVLNPLTPAVPDPEPGEGQWRTLVTAAGIPLVQAAYLRADASHTADTSAVAWINQAKARFVLHPGAQEPGGSSWSQPSSITPDEKPGLIATWNGGFKLQDAQGGFYLDGKTAGTLKDGSASEVIHTDGSLSVGQWGRDFRMGPDIAAVRQNLRLLVDNGQDAPDLNTGAWGLTIKNADYTWRSGVGETADGNIVYAMGPTLNVQTLADLLRNAGAVRAMELDINPDWTSFMTYDGSHNHDDPVPAKLLDTFVHTAARYYSTDSRDFIAVYARP